MNKKKGNTYHNSDVVIHDVEQVVDDEENIEIVLSRETDYKTIGLVRDYVVPDGNCMFSALGWWIKEENKKQHSSTRKKIVGWIGTNLEHPYDFRSDLTFAETIKNEYTGGCSNWLKRMSIRTTWGNSIILQAAAYCYEVKIMVVFDRPRVNSICDLFFPLGEPKATWVIEWQNSNHYNVLRVIDQNVLPKEYYWTLEKMLPSFWFDTTLQCTKSDFSTNYFAYCVKTFSIANLCRAIDWVMYKCNGKIYTICISILTNGMRDILEQYSNRKQVPFVYASYLAAIASTHRQLVCYNLFFLIIHRLMVHLK